MPALLVKADRITIVDRPRGTTVTLVNQDANNDCYFDTDRNRLLASLAGNAPAGTKIAKNGGQLQISAFSAPLYLRSLVDMTLEVQP